MILLTVNSENKSLKLLDLFIKLNIIFVIICLFTSINDAVLAISAAVFILMIILIFSIKKFKKIPGSVYIGFILTTYFSLPITWICARGGEFNFTENFIAPLKNAEYANTLELSILYLTVCVAMLIFGMLKGLSNKIKDNLQLSNNKCKITSLLIIIIFVSAINLFEIIRQIEYYSNRYINDGLMLDQNILAFIFNDTAFLIFFSYIFYAVVRKEELQLNRNKLIYSLVFIVYVVFAVMGSSKAAILTVFIYLFIYPIAVNSSQKEVYWPSNLAFIFLSITSVLVYIFSRSYRQIISDSTGNDFIDSLLNNIILESNGEILEGALILIVNRLSSTFSNYVVIFRHFSTDFDVYFSLEFIQYFIKSLLNLLLPGTPYGEAYFTTANMLPDVLQKNTLYKIGDSSTFWLHSNTQSYTIMGFLLIILGPFFSLFVLFLYGYLYSYLMSKFHNNKFRNWLLFSFTLIFISYGMEAAVQTSIHLLIAINIISISTMGINHFLIKNN